MIGFAAAFADAAMRFFRKHQGIGIPEIAETVTPLISIRDALPKLAAGLFAPVSNDKGNDLASPPTQSGPEPLFVRTPINKGPHFIQFQDIVGLRGGERLWDGLGAGGFFLTTPPEFGGPRRTRAQCRAYWDVHNTH